MKSKNVFKYFALLALLCSVVACAPTDASITILHTNDTHSQVEPIEQGKRDGNHAGYARRMGIIEQERAKTPNVLLVDAGDFSQGTPYFNLFHGRVEVDAMNRMGYDAVTLGNHEFDNGLDTLAAVLKDAQFAVVSANYDVQGTALEGIVKPYVILRRGGMKIGLFGLGVNPQGLVAEKNFAPAKYLEPIPVAQEISTLLKEQHHCDLVVCISHMGTFAHGDKPSDTLLAQSTRYIDVIIGGHTHKIVTNHYVENLDGDSVLLAQMGKSGARIGKITLKMGE
jgi:5'-nucleotidase